MRFHVQFRNTSKEALYLDLAKLHDTTGSYYLPQNANRQSFLPFGDTLLIPGRPQPLRIGPGEILTFIRRIRGEFSGKRWSFRHLYGRLGYESIRSWCSLKEQKDGAFEVQYSHAVPRTGAGTQGSTKRNLWNGKVVSPPVRIVIRKAPVRYGEHEKGADLHGWGGDVAAELRTGLLPQEARIAVGRPCWFRLTLWNGAEHARMYAPVVSLLKPGGLVVTDEHGKAVACTGRGPGPRAAFRIMQPSASLVLCELDLASAYDLSRSGKYRVQFPATGGKHQQEVLLPASNTVEFEAVAGFGESVERVTERESAITGTVFSNDKRPAAGASVFMGPWSEYYVTLPPDLRTAEGVRRVQTGPDGRFRFDAVRPGSYWVAARQKALGSVLQAICFVERPADKYELHLLPGGLRGVVLGKDGRTPRKGMVIEFLKLNKWPTVEDRVVTATDAEGRFWFPAAENGDYWLRVVLRERPWKCMATKVAVDGRDLEVRLRMPSGQLSGTVKTPEGVRVPKARLWLSPRGKQEVQSSLSATTDAEGKFLFDEVPWGKYGVRAKGPPKGPHAKGFGSDYGGKEIVLSEESVRLSIDLVLRGERSKTGKAALLIRDADGRPASDKTVVMLMRDGGQRWEKTDATGTVGLNLSREREYHMRVLVREAKGWALVTVTSADVRDGRTIEVSLRPCGEARGRVIDERTGRALGGIPIDPELQNQSEEPLCVASFPRAKSHVSRHGDGSFHFDTLPPGQYEIRRDRDDSGEHTVRFSVVPRQVTKDILVTRAAPEGAVALRGQLTDGAGEPVANQEVTLRHDQARLSLSLSPPSRALTDARGRFSLYPVKPGYHGYRASLRDGASGPLTKIEVKPGRDTDVVLFRLREAEKQASKPHVGQPDPPGTWGRTIDEWRNRVTPVKAKFNRWEWVEVRVEVENLSELPRVYSHPHLVVVRPDGKRPRNVEMPYQIATGLGNVPTIAAGAKVTTSHSVSHGVDLTMVGKYRVQGSSPPSNVAEFEILPHDPDQPLPPVAAVIPPGLVDAIEAALPKDWRFMGTEDYMGGKKDLNSPRRVYIMYRGDLTTTETLRIGPDRMDYWLYLYDQRSKGPDPIKKHEKDGKTLRLIGETDWFRVYATPAPDPRLGWEDPDGDVAKALKLRRRQGP